MFLAAHEKTVAEGVGDGSPAHFCAVAAFLRLLMHLVEA